MLKISTLLLVVLAAAINAHSVSLRSAPSATDSEPYQVLVAAAGNSFDFGAGLPLTRRHVLTTATLVRGYVSWNIGYGSSQFNRLQYIESSIAYMHPNFNGNTMNDNLGIIVLPTALPRGLLRPIRMPTESEAATFPRLNQEGRLVGFGLVKESNNTKLAPNSVLKTVYLTVGADCAKHFPNTHTGKNFCASDDHPESMNLCRGDVGDAFVVTRRGENVLAGFTSIISKTCKPTEPTSFVRIQSYLGWIAGVTASAEPF